MDQNALYKVILLGETDVGKSSFFVRFRDGRFVENLSGTVGLDETTKAVTYMDNDRKIQVNMQIWDTAGLEKTGRLTNNYYLNSKAIILMYDVTDSTSLHYLGFWLKDSQRYCANAKLFLVGNKIDRSESEVEVQSEAVQNFAEEYKIKSDHLFQISVKTGKGFSAFLSELAKILDKTMEPSVRDNTLTKFVYDEEEEKPCAC